MCKQTTKSLTNLFATTLCLSAVPALVQAVVPPPKASLEKSALYATDSTIKGFRVPITNANGKVQFKDIEITLTVLPNGTVDSIADVTSAPSPKITTGVIAPGTYKSADTGTTCTVTNMTLTNGRIQSFFTCDGPSTFDGQLSVATGGVSAGHPFQTQLVAAGIDTKPDVNTFTWGLETVGFVRVDGCFGNGAQIMGAKTDGSQLILSQFIITTGAFLCSGTLIKQ